MTGISLVQRVFRSAWQHITRNGTVTFSAIFVLTITLIIIAFLVISQMVLRFTLQEIAQKVDINVYFLHNAPSEVVLDVKEKLEDLPEVRLVEYISREEAYEIFNQRHDNDSLTLRSLDELGVNPFGPSLNIHAYAPSQYERVAELLTPGGGLPASTYNLIEDANYYQNAQVIDRVKEAMSSVRRLGLILSLVFGILSILVTFNTLRLAMYASREELSIMQMVGARRRFIQGPLYIAGLLYGIFAAVIALIVLYPLSSWIAGGTTEFFAGFSVFDFFVSNFAWLALTLLAAGAVIGVISSAITSWIYLKK